MWMNMHMISNIGKTRSTIFPNLFSNQPPSSDGLANVAVTPLGEDIAVSDSATGRLFWSHEFRLTSFMASKKTRFAMIWLTVFFLTVAVIMQVLTPLENHVVGDEHQWRMFGWQ